MTRERIEEIAAFLIGEERRTKEAYRANYRPSEIVLDMSEDDLRAVDGKADLGISKMLLRCIKSRLRTIDDERQKVAAIREWAASKVNGYGQWIATLASEGKAFWGDFCTAGRVEEALRGHPGITFRRCPYGDDNQTRLAVFPGVPVPSPTAEEVPLL